MSTPRPPWPNHTMMPIPCHRLHGWWRYSHLVAWQLAALIIAVIGGAFTAAVETGGKNWFVLPGVVLSAVLLASLTYGSVRAECARRYGWLW
jgi:hypothetical protein